MSTILEIYERVKCKTHIKAFNYALTQTEKELHQAAEALIHNLNSLN